MQTMQISELAQAAQTQTETIRVYEREGLLPPAARNAANYRVYEATHVLHLLEKELRRLRKQCSSSEAAADCGILTGLERAAGLPVAADLQLLLGGHLLQGLQAAAHAAARQAREQAVIGRDMGAEQAGRQA